MTPEDKKIWEEVARTIKPLKKKKEESPARGDSTPIKPQRPLSVSVPIDENPPEKRIKKKETRAPFRPKILLAQDRYLTRKLRQGTYHIQATLDLHGQTQEEAYLSLQRFLSGAVERGLKLILVITGKGTISRRFSEMPPQEEAPIGILRQKVPEWLENSFQFPEVLSISTARPQDGGTGAWYVELKSQQIKTTIKLRGKNP